MGSKKKDLEIIYNLQWKNKPSNGGDRANIIGMYDIPATTLNWEIFKSYLLKNSGNVGEDVKVSYITDSNREFPIESQQDFQIALYAFRRKARMGDIVNLKLDRIHDQPSCKNSRHSNDVETQIDNSEAVSLVSTCCNSDSPPDWFITYMTQFKKNIMEEITATVSSVVSNIKLHTVSQPSCYHSRKSKAESSKRIRKLQPLITENSHETKDLIKSLKLEGKLERKLEKLEHKTKKIKEKKLALFTKSSDSDAGQSSSKSHGDKDDDVLLMDAIPVNLQTSIPHMLGGEVYLHKWEVKNTGQLPWSSRTVLMFTWGSKAMKPLDNIVSVPYLKPGDVGVVAARMQIPNQPGQYECYWHFHHKERRFGHWLGCQVIVDDFDLKGNKSVLETTALPSEKQLNENYNIDKAVTQYSEILEGPSASKSSKYTFDLDDELSTEKHTETGPEEPINHHILANLVRDISTRMEDIKLQDPTDTNCSSDSDNQSVVSITESNSSKGMHDEFVVVPIPDCFKIDEASSRNETTMDSSVRSAEHVEEMVENYDDNNNTEETDKNASSSEDAASNVSHKSDIVIVSLPSEGKQDDDYAYVIVDGQKLTIPKKLIKSEYLQQSTEKLSQSNETLTRANSNCSSVEILNKNDVQMAETEENTEAAQLAETIDQPSNTDNDFSSHCSAAGSCYSDANSAIEKTERLFIFPQNCPGYEVVYPTSELNNMAADQNIYTWAKSNTQYSYSATVPEPSQNPPPLNLSTHDRNPFISPEVTHSPNFQQTPPNMRPTAPRFDSPSDNAQGSRRSSTPNSAKSAESHFTAAGIANKERQQHREHVVHILPETLVSGAVNVASSAINTARSVINMIVPQENGRPTTNNLQQPGRWVNGHWVSTNAQTPREANLQALAEMGFWNRDLNATLLARYNDDLSRVVGELVQ